jgi:hypothetical protein
MESPIKSGWKGHLNGFIEKTESNISVSKIKLELDTKTAHSLCNILRDSALQASTAITTEQHESLSVLGAAIGRLIDHPSANNGGRKIIK